MATSQSARAPKFERDDNELLEMVDDKYIKTTKKLDWSAYKKTLTVMDDGRCVNEDGEIVPVTAHEAIKVMIKTPKEDDE
jgi:hypothetical protein